MTLRASNKILYTLIAIFAIVAPALVFYTYGWRLDTDHLQIVKIGGIFVKNLPADALLKIDNKPLKSPVKKFFSGSLIENLLPATYQAMIEKDGYYSWSKTLAVEPASVTETKSIVLVPKKASETIVDGPLLNFWINDGKLIYRELSQIYFWTDLENPKTKINLSLLFNNLKESILNLPGYIVIADILPQESPNRWILNTQKYSYLIDIKKLSLELLPEKISEKPLPLALEETEVLKKLNIAWSGPEIKISRYKDNQHLFVLKSGSLYFVEVDKREPINSVLVAKNVKNYSYDSSKLYLLIGNKLRYLSF